MPASAAAFALRGVGRLNQGGCHQHSSRREQLLDHDKRPTNFDGRPSHFEVIFNPADNRFVREFCIALVFVMADEALFILRCTQKKQNKKPASLCAPASSRKKLY